MTSYYSRYLQGRNANGHSGDAGKLYHVVMDDYLPSFSKALCGASPGKRSGGWSDYVGSFFGVNCERCQCKLAKIIKEVAPSLKITNEIEDEEAK